MPGLIHPKCGALRLSASTEAPVGLGLQTAEQISAIDAEALSLTLAVAQEPLSAQKINVEKVFIGYSLKPGCIFSFMVVISHSIT